MATYHPDSPINPATGKPYPRTNPRGTAYGTATKKNPRVIRYKRKPKLDPKKFTIKKRGGGLGYVAIRKKTAGTAGGGTGAAAAPAPPPGPYDSYRETAPWAIPLLQQIDRDEKFHTQYATGVGDWLSKALTGLTGVDPNAPGYNQTAQQQYLANVAGSTGAALNAAAVATPSLVAPTTGGGIVQGNNAFMGEAARTAAAQRSSASLQETQARSALNSIQSNTYAQGAIRAFADLQAGLPQVYAKKRMEQRAKIDEFVAEQQMAAAELAEETRANKVQEAISAQNAQTNAAIQFGRLGLSAEELAMDSQPGAPMPTNLPPGTIAVPTDDGGWSVRNAPRPATSRTAAGNKPMTPSQISSMNGKWKRPKSSPPKLGPGWKQPVWDPGTKTWYAKRAAGATGSGGTKPPKVVPYGKLVTDLKKQFEGKVDAFGSGTPGWSETFKGDQAGLRDAFAGWVIENAGSFNTKGGKFDPDKLLRALATLGDGNKKFALIWPTIRKRLKNGKLV